jgi:hypothetical protein
MGVTVPDGVTVLARTVLPGISIESRAEVRGIWFL